MRWKSATVDPKLRVNASVVKVSLVTLVRFPRVEAVSQAHSSVVEDGPGPILAVALAEGRARKYERGAIIFTPSHDAQCVYVLSNGLVRLYRLSESGGEVGYGYVRPGEVFGEVGCFRDGYRKEFAEAVTDAEAVEIPSDTFRKWIISQPAIAFEVARQIHARLGRIEARFEALVLHEVGPRIAQVLLQLSDEFGLQHGDHLTIDVPLTQTQLAALAGTTRQTANLHLRRLQRAGLVARRGGRIVLLDRSALTRVTGEVQSA